MSDTPQREMTLKEQVADHIGKLERQIEYMAVTHRKVPKEGVVTIAAPEIDLARQDLETALARMRKVQQVVDPPEPEPTAEEQAKSEAAKGETTGEDK